MCGGTRRKYRYFGLEAVGGLSPRVRGNLQYRATDIDRSIWVYPRVCGGTPRLGANGVTWRKNRSIPACAGEPWPSFNAESTIELPGLSPRVRGNPNYENLGPRTLYYGSIPACAGEPNTVYVALIQQYSAVYPRVCGGTYCDPLRYLEYQGLKVYPRVCGGTCFFGPPGAVPVSRSIPACAGEPIELNQAAWVGGVRGLSPRVRGNQFRQGTA